MPKENRTRLVSVITPILFVFLLTRCGNPVVPVGDKALGEWEKADNLLPPINLVLSRDDGRIVARLRLSGVEANGTATLSDNKLRLTFPGRQDATGEFILKDELKLRLDPAGPDFVLKKRGI